MVIDCYGYESQSPFYQRRRKQLYESSKEGGVTFLRFSRDETGPIHRIEELDGITRISWSYGSWADRKTLAYETDLNTPIEISGE